MSRAKLKLDLDASAEASPQGAENHGVSPDRNMTPLTERQMRSYVSQAEALVASASHSQRYLQDRNRCLEQELEAMRLERLREASIAQETREQSRVSLGGDRTCASMEGYRRVPVDHEVDLKIPDEPTSGFTDLQATAPTSPSSRSVVSNSSRNHKGHKNHDWDLHKKIVPNFNAEDTVTVTAYLKQFGLIRQELKWDDSLAGFHLVRALTGKAIQVLSSIQEAQPGYEVLAKALLAKFEPETQMEAHQNQFEYKVRDVKRETPHQFAENLKELAIRAFPFMDQSTVEYQVRKQFERGQPAGIRRMMACNPALNTVDKCVAMVSKFEACIANDSMKRVGSKPVESYVPTVNAAGFDDEQAESDSSFDLMAGYSDSEYEVNGATGKFAPPRRGQNGPRSNGNSSGYRNLQEQLRNMERELEKLKRECLSNASNPSAHVRAVEAEVPEDSQCGEFPVYELMATLGFAPPTDTRNTSHLSCWYCHETGHGFARCAKLRNVLYEEMRKRGDGKSAALKTLPPVNTSRVFKKGN